MNSINIGDNPVAWAQKCGARLYHSRSPIPLYPSEVKWMSLELGVNRFVVVKDSKAIGVIDRPATRDWVFTRLAKEDWVQYQGRKGGRGIQNIKTGEVLYGVFEPPGSDNQPEAPQQPQQQAQQEPQQPAGQPQQQNAAQEASAPQQQSEATPEPQQEGLPDSQFSSNVLFGEELSLPVAVNQKQNTKDGIYQHASKSKQSFDHGLNTGQGVDKVIGARAVVPESREDFLNSLDQEGPMVIIAPLKGEKRATEKVEKKYGGDWSKLTDVVRATVALESKNDIPKAIEAAKTKLAENGWRIATKPENRIEEPTAAGYRDINTLWVSDDGHVAELQFNTKSMLKAKETTGHSLYEEYRSISEPIKSSGRKPTNEESSRLTELENQMKSTYETAWK